LSSLQKYFKSKKLFWRCSVLEVFCSDHRFLLKAQRLGRISVFARFSFVYRLRLWACGSEETGERRTWTAPREAATASATTSATVSTPGSGGGGGGTGALLGPVSGCQ